MTIPTNSLASLVFRGNHFGAARGGTETVLFLIGLAFAGVLVWAIERGGRATTR